MDHIHVVNQIIKKSAEYTRYLYVAFVDYKKTFDSVLTAAVLEALKDQGIAETEIILLEDVYKGSTGGITLQRQSDTFPIRKGVRQGDTISPKLFTACLEGVFRKLDWENIGLRVNGEYLSHLRFADEIVLRSETAEHMQRMLQELQ